MTMSKPFGLLKFQSFSAYFLFLTFFCLLWFNTAVAHTDADTAEIAKQRIEIANLTAQLGKLLGRYRNAPAETRDTIADEMQSLAQQRQQLLLEVVEDNPQLVLKYAIPKPLQSQYPAQIQALFEHWVAAEGSFEVYYEDHDDLHKSRLRFYLKQDKKQFALSVAGDKKPSLQTGASVIIQGLLFNNTDTGGEPVIALESDQLMLAAGGSGDPVISSTPTILDNTLGEQRTVVFLVNFQDKPENKPWTVEQTYERFFSAINQFFLETSYQQTWLTGDVFGWYTLPINSTDSCSQTAIADAADDAAMTNNIDLSQYDRFVYVFPQNSCSWSGFAMVGGMPSRAWVNADLYGKTPAHEIGHNFGLYHSHGLNCEGDVTETNCTSITYGDLLDTMGARPGHFNAFQKERLGWLNQNQTPPIVTVDQAGSYAIELMETTSNNAKALKVFKDTDPYSGMNRWYYIEFRQAVGADQFINPDYYLVSENITNGITVHLGTDQNGDSSYLLDMTPESTSYTSAFGDLYDPSLTVGNSYNDSTSGLTITTEHTDAQSATVYISYDGSASSTCTHAAPVIEVSPTASQWVAAGVQVDFTVTVTNHDSSGCSTTNFDISPSLPSNWIANTAALSLLPGETSSAIISVTSAVDAVDDFYDIVITATNTDNSSYFGNTTATYVVSSGSSNTAPDAVNDEVLMTAVEPIVIDVLSNDSDPDADAIYISAVSNAAKGDITVNAGGSLLYTPAKSFKSSDSFTYTISDGQSNDTATVLLTLQSSNNNASDSTKGGGKGGGKPSK